GDEVLTESGAQCRGQGHLEGRDLILAGEGPGRHARQVPGLRNGRALHGVKDRRIFRKAPVRHVFFPSWCQAKPKSGEYCIQDTKERDVSCVSLFWAPARSVPMREPPSTGAEPRCTSSPEARI